MSLEEESEEDAIRKADLAWQEFDQQRRDRRLARIAELEQRIAQLEAEKSRNLTSADGNTGYRSFGESSTVEGVPSAATRTKLLEALVDLNLPHEPPLLSMLPSAHGPHSVSGRGNSSSTSSAGSTQSNVSSPSRCGSIKTESFDGDKSPFASAKVTPSVIFDGVLPPEPALSPLPPAALDRFDMRGRHVSSSPALASRPHSLSGRSKDTLASSTPFQQQRSNVDDAAPQEVASSAVHVNNFPPAGTDFDIPNRQPANNGWTSHAPGWACMQQAQAHMHSYNSWTSYYYGDGPLQGSGPLSYDSIYSQPQHGALLMPQHDIARSSHHPHLMDSQPCPRAHSSSSWPAQSFFAQSPATVDSPFSSRAIPNHDLKPDWRG